MRLAHCRSCGAPIIWVTTGKGKTMPIDADPVRAERGFRLDDSDQDRPTVTFVGKPEPDEKVYESHFSTCPDADQHRRPA